jgi:histidinol phosphatase-like PHP family hydrolase
MQGLEKMKIDLHVHTSGISFCGHVTAQETLALYGTTDYDAIVITNHFARDTARNHIKRTGKDFFDLYQEEFRTAEEAGKKYGKKVDSKGSVDEYNRVFKDGLYWDVD